jgi:hypothetical protein
MTLIAIWLENDTLFAASDTQFSTSIAATVLAEIGTKVFPLSLRWGNPDNDGDTTDGVALRFQSSTVGFAFAGRVLPAVMTLAFANACLQNLMSVSDAVPDLSHCAELIRKISEQFLQDSVHKYKEAGHFSIAIFGRCPQTRKLRAFKLSSEAREHFSLGMRLSECNLPHEMIVLGSNSAYQQYFRDRVTEIKENGDHHGETEMAPQSALAEIIDAGSIPGVGGVVQLSFVAGNELELTAAIAASDKEDGGFARSYLGISLDRLEPVGKFSISIPLNVF